MSWEFSFESKTDTRQKVFISYYHKDDQRYRDRFEKLFGPVFITKSVEPCEIDTDDSTDYIKQLIQQNYITDTSVVVVLVGAKTYCRKHVDWEISAALNKKVGRYSGLLGLCLPTHPDYKKTKYQANIVPPRLVANIKSGYAEFYDWTADESKIKDWIEEAFRARIGKTDKIDDSMLLLEHNRCK